jgi:putative ABC transport system permease protein
METLLQDIRYAVASMRRNPGFTTAGLLTLALGIGATTSVFSVVYGVLLRPLPYPAAERLVRLSEEHPGANSPLRAPMLSNLTFHAWAKAPRTVEQFAAYRTEQYTVTRDGESSRLAGCAMTPSMFALLGETPALGRFFLADEAAEGAAGVMVVSDRAWRERFNGDPSIVGRGLTIDGKSYTVIGVARPGFSFPSPDALMWTPLAVRTPSPDAVAGRTGNMSVVYALARLGPGITPAQAEAEGTAAARTTVRPMAANLLFGVGGPPTVHVRGMVDEMTARIRPALLVLAGGVVCLLLIACANVANLFLSRGVARQRELTVRAAIGASRGRLACQLLTESVVLSSIGGALGLALAWTIVRVAPIVVSRDFPRLDAIRIDGGTIAFTAAATCLTAILSGLAPALRGARFNLAESLHGGDGASAGGFRGLRARRLRDGLLVAESAFAVLLMVAATMLARSFIKLTQVDAGYTSDGVLAAEIYLPGGDADDRGPAMNALVTSLVARAGAMPGTAAAGASNMMPLDGATQIAGFPAPWTAPGAEPVPARTLQYVVTPGYAEALGLRLRAGRLFTEADYGAGTRPWIVNEEFARLYLPPNPIGYRFEQRRPSGPIAMEIVGIVANTLKDGNDRTPQPEYYRLARDQVRFYGRFELAIRTEGAPAAAASGIRALVRELAPTAAVETVTLSERVAASVDQPRFATTVLTTFALLAVSLASAGLYSVVSYGVSQRRRELGVRAALGAGRAALVRLVLRDGLRVTAIGLACGLAGAAVLSRLMQGVLFGVAPLDAVAFITAPAVLLVVAVIACLLPAIRGARTDPAEALRAE